MSSLTHAQKLAIAPHSLRPGVRFSFSKYNTKEEIDYTIEKLKDLFA